MVGRISRSAGPVSILRGSQAIAGALDTELLAADRIQTGADARAEVTFSDGSVLTVGPASDVAIAAFAPDPGESNAVIDLLSGIVRATVNKATGWKSTMLANSSGVFTGTTWTADMQWCKQADDQLLIGDFDNDGRDDMLCHQKVTGWKSIARATHCVRNRGWWWRARTASTRMAK